MPRTPFNNSMEPNLADDKLRSAKIVSLVLPVHPMVEATEAGAGPVVHMVVVDMHLEVVTDGVDMVELMGVAVMAVEDMQVEGMPVVVDILMVVMEEGEGEVMHPFHQMTLPIPLLPVVSSLPQFLSRMSVLLSVVADIQLPWSTSNQDLVELFTTIGKVDRAEIGYEPSGRSRGIGVVQFEAMETAESAIQKFQGYLYGGRYFLQASRLLT